MSHKSAPDRPRRVAIFLAELGGGHRSVALALRETLLAKGQNIRVDLIDVFRQCSVFPLTAIPRLYSLFTTRWLFLWHSLYYATNSLRRYEFAERLAQPFLQPKLDRYVAGQSYDVLVAVFPALGRFLAHARRLLPGRAPVVTVVIDLVTVHPAWICTEVDWYIVPTLEAGQSCVSHGISQDRVHVMGLPIRGIFNRAQPPRKVARLDWGLRPDPFTVLIMGGGEGSGRVAGLTRLLARHAPPLQLLVVTGRNKELRRTLTTVGRPPWVNVLGYVDDVRSVMMAADLVVTKAGPCTIAESVACQRPLLITDHLPQEAGNVSYVCQNGLGWSFRDIGAIRCKVLSLAADDGGELRDVQQVATKLAWYDAADRAAEWILTCSN